MGKVINSKYTVKVHTSVTRLLLGLGGQHDMKLYSVFDVLCTLTKNYIHVSKCTENARNSEGMWKHIHGLKALEQRIAISNNYIENHKQKWDKFADL